MLHQLVSLERRTARGGKDSIDHPRGAHDDVANAVAGAVVIAGQQPPGWRRKRWQDEIKPPEWTAERYLGPALAGGRGSTDWLYKR